MKTLLSIILALFLASNAYGSSVTVAGFQSEDQDNRLIDVDAVDDATVGATEETVYSFTIPADILGTTSKLRLVLVADMAGGTNATTFRLKYGSTTLVTVTGSPGNDPTPVLVTAELASDGSTALQVGSIVIQFDDSNSDAGGGTSAEDSTGALLIDFTVDTTSAGQTLTVRHATLQLLSEAN